MPKRVNRKLELYAIHAHNINDDYEGLFKAFVEIPSARRISNVYGNVIGFPIATYGTDGVFIQATEGDPDAAALVFDSSTGNTRETRLRSGEVLSEAVHLFVIPSTRRAVIEYTRRGIKARFIGPAIEDVVRSNSAFSRVRLEFTAITTESFVKDIRSFERIRIASLRVIRPNASWTDHYNDLSDLIEESNGEKAEIDVRAGRGESLDKERGIVKVITDVASDNQPYLDEAAVTGTRASETKETTVRSSMHIKHTRTSVDADDAGVPTATSIRAALRRFILGATTQT